MTIKVNNKYEYSTSNADSTCLVRTSNADSTCLVCTSNIVTGVGKEIAELTQYSEEELTNRNISVVFSELLRLPSGIYEQLELYGITECFLFTKSLEVREVTISVCEINIPGTNQRKYIINEKANSRLEDKLIFIEQLFSDNIFGCAIYSYPDLILLKANQQYLNFIDTPFNVFENSIGKSISEIINGFKGSIAETIWNSVIINQRSVYLKENRYDRFSRGITYWDSVLTPVFEKEKPKYIFEKSFDATERVICRKKAEENVAIIQQQNEQLNKQNEMLKIQTKLCKKVEDEFKTQNELLETIIENMSVAFAVIDKEGNFILKNAEARKMYPQPGILENIDNAHKAFDLFDLDGNRIMLENLPSRRAFRGERIKNEIIAIKRDGKDQITEINCTPIFDSNNNITSVAVFHRDITEIFLNQKLIKNHQEKMLQTEIERNEALKREIEMKDEFLSLVSHEFKTPLTVINSSIQAMELICKKELSDKGRRFLDKIRQNSNRQLKLINNLLDITRINAGHLKINNNNIDIVLLTRSITDSIMIFSEQKKIKLSFSSTLRKKIIWIDDEKYERILLNLLSNAIKYTPEGKSITVSVSQKTVGEKCMINIQVSDNGVGIPSDKKDLIFEKFGQVDNTLTRKAEGTGIGLHLVKMLVGLMGGEITVESVLGDGSTFSVLLPVEKSKDMSNKQMIKEIAGSRLLQTRTVEFSDIYF